MLIVIAGVLLAAAAAAPARPATAQPAGAPGSPGKAVRVIEAMTKELFRVETYLVYYDQVQRLEVAQGLLGAAAADARLRQRAGEVYARGLGEGDLRQITDQHRRAASAYFDRIAQDLGASRTLPPDTPERYRALGTLRLARLRREYEALVARGLDPRSTLERAAEIHGWSRGEVRLTPAANPFAGQDARVAAAIPSPMMQAMLTVDPKALLAATAPPGAAPQAGAPPAPPAAAVPPSWPAPPPPPATRAPAVRPPAPAPPPSAAVPPPPSPPVSAAPPPAVVGPVPVPSMQPPRSPATGPPQTVVVTPGQPNALGPAHDGWNLSGGEVLRFYAAPNELICRSDCEHDGACQAYTWVKPGGYRPGDGPVCYLMRSYTSASPNRCCITATRGPFPGR